MKHYKGNPHYISTVRENTQYFNAILSKKPSSIKELIDGVDGSHHRSLSDMINGCGQTEAEKEVIDYYIWKIAVPRIRIENILAKAEVDELFLKLSKDELDKNYDCDEDDESDEVN